MKIPEKFVKYPWRTAGVFVSLGLLVVVTLSIVFGPDRVAGWIDFWFGIAVEGGGK